MRYGEPVGCPVTLRDADLSIDGYQRARKRTSAVVRLHPSRSVCGATCRSDELAIPADVIGRLLNHSPKGVTERHYVHHKPQQLVDIYDRFYSLVDSTISEFSLMDSLYTEMSNEQQNDEVDR